LDLDDCLIDHKAWMDDKLSIVLREWDSFADPALRGPFEAAARRLIDEGPWDRLIDVALQMIGADGGLACVVIERWRAAHPEAVVAYPDAVATVQALRDAGIRVAVVTDNPAASQRQKLERIPFLCATDVVVLTDELGGRKPKPAGYVAAARQLQLEPPQMVAIGDSPWRDAVGALAAGFAAAFILRRPGAMGNPSCDRFARAHPNAATKTYWLDDLREVPQMLGIPTCKTT
jgi:HAD superfamily hydrolase (TIGR01509 family)